MLVGIYMPAGTIQRGALPPVDGLETYFLRHAIQGIANSKTNTDTQFVWFYEKGARLFTKCLAKQYAGLRPCLHCPMGAPRHWKKPLSIARWMCF